MFDDDVSPVSEQVNPPELIVPQHDDMRRRRPPPEHVGKKKKADEDAAEGEAEPEVVVEIDDFGGEMSRLLNKADAAVKKTTEEQKPDGPADTKPDDQKDDGHIDIVV